MVLDIAWSIYITHNHKKEKMKLKNKKGAAGLITGIVGLIGGTIFIWFLITMAGFGSITTFFNNNPKIIMLIILIIFVWIVTRK